MPDSPYARIVRSHLEALFHAPPPDLAARLGGAARRDGVALRAFGEACDLTPRGIFLGGRPQTGVLGILIALYGRHAHPAPQRLEPWRAFKELPGSMPYAGAFAANAEGILVPHAASLEHDLATVTAALDGGPGPVALGGDFAFSVRPFPKISLCYIVHRADEEFCAAVTCLFSANADRFLPLDALADTAEYTGRGIIALLQGGAGGARPGE
ncbi:MAG: DUF3786 domain-containing protein [Desulfobacterales bacterium]|nr:DUF3786 domain-containing protein [Desulfobacterales bacterium]